MRRAIVALCFGACALHAAGRAQQATFRATTDVVSVDVAVTKGRTPVPGLTAREFVLSDNGVRQDVDAVQLETRPIDVTLIFAGALDSQRRQLGQGVSGVQQLRALLLPTDRLRVVSAGNDVRELAPMRFISDRADLPVLSGNRGVSLNDALFYALAWPADPERRHLVVAFTNGLDPWDSTIEFRLVPEIARRADAVLHAVIYEVPSESAVANPKISSNTLQTDGAREGWAVYGGGAMILSHWRETYAALDDAVQLTGGTIRLIQNGVERFQEILADFRSSYLLRYTPRHVTPGGWHAIDVKVTRPGLTVRARKGYE